MFATHIQHRQSLSNPDPIGQGSIFHVQTHPFWNKPACSCHRSPTLIRRVGSNNDRASSADVVRIVRGETC